jgi:hypothetical protein
MMFERGLVIGWEKILRPAPRALALDHRVDADVADPELPHACFPPKLLETSITGVNCPSI